MSAIALGLGIVLLVAGMAKMGNGWPFAAAFRHFGYTSGFRLFVGTLEVVASTLLIWPSGRVYGGVLAAMLMGGAVATHLMVGQWLFATVPLLLFGLAAVVVWQDRPDDLWTSYPTRHAPWNDARSRRFVRRLGHSRAIVPESS